MERTVIHEGAGFVICVCETAGTMLPYWGFPSPRPDGSQNHGWLDLRGRPDLVPLVPELEKSAGMREIVRFVAKAYPPLMSITCDCGLRNEKKSGMSQVDGWIDITFDDPQLIAFPGSLLDLAIEILRGIPPPPDGIYYMFHFMVEKLKTFFGIDGCYALQLSVAGRGEDSESAWRSFDAGMTAIAASLANLYPTAQEFPNTSQKTLGPPKRAKVRDRYCVPTGIRTLIATVKE